MNKQVKHTLIRLASILVGLILFVSGTLKLADPVGTGLIVDSYWEFFGLGFLSGISKAFGFALALFEATLGATLLTGVFRRFSAWATTILIGFFTIITLILWIFNPEMDCGCFGQAIHLSHGQSLLKNIVLLALSAGVVLPFKGGFLLKKRRRYPAFGLLEAGILAGAIFSLISIPTVDFTPFKPGVELAAGLHNESGRNGHERTYIYEKDGLQQQFSLSELPDSSWTYVGVGEETGEVPTDDDRYVILPISTPDGEGYESIAATGDVMVFSVYKPGKGERFWNKLKVRMEAAREAGFTPLLLVAGEAPASFAGEAYLSDYRTLVSLNRDNGGATWFHDGMLVEKWSRTFFPETDELKQMLSEDCVKQMMEEDTSGRIRLEGFYLYAIAVLLLV